jgi:solute carrier family 10 (sodium/bile acid cotransporter), member 7
MKNRLFSQLKTNAFILCLIVVIVLAWLYPAPGTADSPLHLSSLCTYGVSIIFFFYGLRLSAGQMKAGLVNWRLHLLIQATTFLLFPILLFVLSYFFRSDNSSLLWLGAFYLAALPSTVSSSVVMVSMAGGNIPAAIFNASLSSILGIFITPLWMSLWLSKDGDFEIADTVLKLCIQVLLPVVAGILLHGRWGAWAEKIKTITKNFDQFIILLIIYTSFCESFSRRMFNGFSLLTIFILGLLMLSLFAAIFLLVGLITTRFGFARDDRITALFCGSKKSLVQGAVMGKVLFPDQAVLGIVLLPLMLYHALQLLAGSALAHRMRKKQ